ncbi:MAG: helix-turn-helix domain-containing protein [Caulobacter sp.]|nr:helix-turn-helix domain-containing protein [Caulobacter sp.]
MKSLLRLENRLLTGLSPDDLEKLTPHLNPVYLEKGRLLYEPGDVIDTVYFPHDCVVSMMTLLDSGAAIESMTIGREGAVGLAAARQPRESLSRLIVQISGDASRIPAAQLGRICKQSPHLTELVDRYGEAMFGHVIQSVACNALHSVEARFCRWLLSCRDRIDADTVTLTQEFLADMLGVQRTTVTAVAGALQQRELIRYRRGIVDILDRAGLEAAACECYGAVHEVYERLLPGSFKSP